MTIDIRDARADDRTAVEALLANAGLPLDGVDEHFAQFVVAETGGAVVGAAGLERHGDYALMRSVVVAHHLRGQSTGRRLTEAILAKADGARAVLGFRTVPREGVPESLTRSREFQGACPASAIVMQLPMAAG